MLKRFLNAVINRFILHRNSKKKEMCYYALLLADKDVRRTFYGGC